MTLRHYKLTIYVVVYFLYTMLTPPVPRYWKQCVKKAWRRQWVLPVALSVKRQICPYLNLLSRIAQMKQRHIESKKIAASGRSYYKSCVCTFSVFLPHLFLTLNVTNNKKKQPPFKMCRHVRGSYIDCLLHSASVTVYGMFISKGRECKCGISDCLCTLNI